MNQPRRAFCVAFGWFAAAASLGLPARAQQQNPRQGPPDSASNGDDKSPAFPNTKAILEDNQKDIKKNVEKLFRLASDLKAEVEKTNSVQVLSLAMLRKTEEIEKLAHEIRARAKG